MKQTRKHYIYVKTTLYTFFLWISLIVPLLLFYTAIEDTTTCMHEYIQSMEESGYYGYIYKINGSYHIEPANKWKELEKISEYRVGTAHGCIMSSNNILVDFINTFYCTTSYMIIKNPFLPETLKNPLPYFQNKETNFVYQLHHYLKNNIFFFISGKDIEE